MKLGLGPLQGHCATLSIGGVNSEKEGKQKEDKQEREKKKEVSTEEKMVGIPCRD